MKKDAPPPSSKSAFRSNGRSAGRSGDATSENPSYTRKPDGKKPSFGKKMPGKDAYGSRAGSGGSPNKNQNQKWEKPRAKASVFGLHAVREAWLNEERVIKTLYITEEALKEFSAVIEEGREKGLTRPGPSVSERKTIDNATMGGVHQGIAIVADPLPETSVQDIAAMCFHKKRSVILVLDQLTDPHNIGAIMRSAAAFGADGIVMQRRHAPEISGVLAKTASGAAEHMPVAYEINLSRAIEVLQQKGYRAIAMDERAPQSFGEAELPEKAVLVLGAEGKGLRQKIREQCDLLLRLPTQGAIQSLNVSNAAAIALYALAVRP